MLVYGTAAIDQQASFFKWKEKHTTRHTGRMAIMRRLLHRTLTRDILCDMFLSIYFLRGIKEMLEVQVYKENQELWYVSDKTVN